MTHHHHHLLLPLLSLSLSLLFSHSLAANYRAKGCDGSTNRTKLYIQGFVPASGNIFTSENIVPAASIACREVNSNTSVLSDYELVIEWSDTECDASEATWQLIQVVLDDNGTEPDPRIMFLGGGCSPATEPLAALSGRFYNVSQVSYGASTPTLSDIRMFPKFFRTIPSEVQANSARFALMKRFKWEKVATLHETRNIFSTTVNDFRQDYFQIFKNTSSQEEDDRTSIDDEDSNLVVRSFTDDPEIPLRQIKEKDIRIIFAFMYEDKALNTTCQAIYMNLTSPNHVWVFPAWYTSNWWNKTVQIGDKISCTPDMMREALRYSLFLDSYNETTDRSIPADSGITIQEFENKFAAELVEFNTSGLYHNDPNRHHYATFAYDAVWTMALALNRTETNLQDYGITLKDFEYSNNLGITENITHEMNNTNIRGVSGDLRFDANGSRVGLSGIYQLVPTDENGLKLELLFVHSPHRDDPNNTLPTSENESLWITVPYWKNGPDAPHDRRQPVTVYLNRNLIITCDFFISIAIIVAVGLLIFNLSAMFKPLIRDSAPIINTIIICGCILLLITCYLLGIDTNTPRLKDDQPSLSDQQNIDNENGGLNDRRNARYANVCQARLWLFTIGFSLSFGALFAKTWQVYRVYTNPKLKKEPFKLWNFLIIMAVFLTIDVVYLSIWTGAFPFARLRDETENNQLDTLELYEKCFCENFNYLIGALYVYKGLLVVFGLFLAYESRNVKYYYINDSRFTSIAVYIVVIVVGIGAPLSLVLSEHLFVDPAYGLTIVMVIIATMSCLLILFIPKFYYMSKGKETMVSENTREEVTAGDGLQLGRTSVDQTDMQTAEEEVRELQEKVVKKTTELQSLEDTLSSPTTTTSDTCPKSQCGSDGDSGVLVTTTDEQPEVFVSAGTPVMGEPANGTSSSSNNTTPNEADEGL